MRVVGTTLWAIEVTCTWGLWGQHCELWGHLRMRVVGTTLWAMRSPVHEGCGGQHCELWGHLVVGTTLWAMRSPAHESCGDNTVSYEVTCACARRPLPTDESFNSCDAPWSWGTVSGYMKEIQLINYYTLSQNMHSLGDSSIFCVHLYAMWCDILVHVVLYQPMNG